MTGILLVFVMVIWIAVAVWFSKVVTSGQRMAAWRVPVAVMIFAALLPLPLLDEIVGGRQFARLCKENSTIQVDRAKAVGKTVYLAITPDVEVEGTWPWRFVETTSGATVVSYNTLMAEGGRFIRTLGISEGGVPLTFRGTVSLAA